MQTSSRASGTGYVTGSRLAPHIGAWGANFWALLAAGALQLPLLFMLPMSVDWAALTYAGWGGLLYLVLLVGILGYTAWYWALSKGGVVRMAPVQFAQPLVSLVIAVALFSETMTMPLTVAAVLILAGIIIARKGTT
ncbi:MAG: EamA family transporter [Magnetovibrio sp.]|nr:EamA family transporter [Magnetovibrio sp.]